MDLKAIPFTDVKFAPVRPRLTTVDANTWLLGNDLPLPELAGQMTEHLWRTAETAPERWFLAQRKNEDSAQPWRAVTYGEAALATDRISSWLLARSIPSTSPILILSENSLGQALLTLAAGQIGLPVLPVSPNYALADASFTRLRWIYERFAPALVYAEDARYAAALAALGVDPDRILVGHADAAPARAHSLETIRHTSVSPGLARAKAAVNGATVAKIILTSGSTGTPKGVAITHRMMMAAAESFYTLWPFLADRPPVMVDWLPWNHTAGSNGTFNLILRSGGTLYIDDGKPTAQGIQRTLDNLRLVAPTLMFNVPRGYEYLVPQLEREPELTRHLFQDLDVLLYAGAGLSQDMWDRLERLAVQVRGRRIPIVSSLGSTETASPATLSWWGADITGSIGLPVPGVEAKLILHEAKMEVRFRGATVMSQYWDDAERSSTAFDEAGFFRIGDAVSWMDPHDAAKGLCFDGRLAENFKLSSGTWVSVGTLRLDIIAACTPWVEDVVIAGESRPDIGLLVFLNPSRMRELQESLSPQAARQTAIDAIRQALTQFNGAHKGASQRIGRFLVEDDPLDANHGEITDKGYVAQTRVLQRRVERVDKLYDATTEDTIVIT